MSNESLNKIYAEDLGKILSDIDRDYDSFWDYSLDGAEFLKKLRAKGYQLYKTYGDD